MFRRELTQLPPITAPTISTGIRSVGTGSSGTGFLAETIIKTMEPQLLPVISAIDVQLGGNVTSKGTAYRDAGESYEDFLKNVSKNERIIGFEWNPNEQKLGIILGN